MRSYFYQVFIILLRIFHQEGIKNCLFITQKSANNFYCTIEEKIFDYEIQLPSNFSSYNSVAINNKNLKILQDDIFSSLFVQHLDLSSNEIEIISQNCFRELSGVINLDLSQNKLTSLQNLSYSLEVSYIDNLKYLYLDNNRLEFLDLNFSNAFQKLQNLSLENNYIKFISYDFLSNLFSLNDLNIRNNELREVKFDPNLWLNKSWELNNLILSHNRLGNISFGYDSIKMVVKLDLSYNHLKILDKESFNYMTNVKILFLNNNRIKLLNEDIFFNLTSIESIDLSFNLIETLPSYLFNNLENLRDLNFEFNSIKKIEKNSMINLKNLNNLNLGNNQIEKIQNDLNLNCKDKIIIYFQNNNISSIDNKTFYGFNKIGQLYLYIKKAELIRPFSFFSFKIAKVLYLNENGLKEIEPWAFYGLEKLNYLYLRRNRLTVLRENTFRGLYNLDILDLSENNIYEIEKEAFNDIENLIALNLNGNFLESIPLEITKIENLQKLYLSNNSIKNIFSHSLGSLYSLKSLFLDSNKISQIEKFSFENLIALSKISLSNNQIEKITEIYFESLSFLSNLNLKNNKIISVGNSFSDNYLFDLDLSYNSISNLDFFLPASLENLNLEFNEIECVLRKFFSESSKLVYLNLAHNKIFFIEKSSLKYLYSLKYLRMENNRLGNFFDVADDAILKMKELNLNYNFISDISFLKNFDLNKIFISHNNISSIKREDIENLENLENIDLSWNPIQILEANVFENKMNLEKINLSNLFNLNSIKLSVTKSVKTIDLRFNNFQFLEIVSTSQANYKILFDYNSSKLNENSSLFLRNCTKCKLFNLNKNFGDFLNHLSKNSQIETLDLSSNNLNDINLLLYLDFPEKIKFLYLKKNQIKNVSFFQIKNMLALKSLDLSFNQLEIIEKKILSLSSLTYLHLQNNNLKVIHVDNILSNLMTIDLSNNKIVYYEQSKYTSSSLLDLYQNCHKLLLATNKDETEQTSCQSVSLVDLSKNNLENFLFKNNFFKQIITRLNELVIIKLNNNKLTKINSNSFKKLLLKELDLSFNFIDEINSNALLWANHLTILNLSHNKLKKIQADLFSQCNILTIINLSNNYLETFEKSTFSGLFKLEILNLANNNLKLIDKELFFQLNRLHTINISLNVNLILKNDTFIHLKYIKYIYLDFENVNKSYYEIIQSLKLRFVKEVLKSKYFESIRVFYLEKNLIDCVKTVYFLRNKILLNMEDNKDFEFIFLKCKKMMLN